MVEYCDSCDEARVDDEDIGVSFSNGVDDDGDGDGDDDNGDDDENDGCVDTG